jgi:hypothetical protein
MLAIRSVGRFKSANLLRNSLWPIAKRKATVLDLAVCNQELMQYLKNACNSWCLDAGIQKAIGPMEGECGV